jgi:phosphoserine phosphatase RsbU/P
MARRRKRERKQSGSGGFFHQYTAGLRRSDLRRLFDREAPEAYAVLTRDQAAGEEPSGNLRRFFYRARLLFLGLSYKLSPPRRLLFAVALVCAFFAVSEVRFGYDSQGVRVSFDASPFFAAISIGCLLFLLALELVDRVRVRDELEVARQLQRELLPQQAPALPGFAFAHSYRTANEVGGDYYDFIPLPDGRLVLVAGDASGHGMAAGLLMAIANATLHTAVDLDPRPAAAAGLLNRALCRSGGKRSFMTLFYGLLEPASGRFDYLCAGHPYPLLRRADGSLVELGSGGLPLGLRTDLELAERSVEFTAGDLLVLYTDGVAETVDAAGVAFGFDRLAALVRPAGGAQAVHDRVLAAFDAHLGAGSLTDDLSLVVVERLPA